MRRVRNVQTQKREHMNVTVESLAKTEGYVKCPRCWHYTHEGVHNPETLCDRCCTAMVEGWPDDPIVPEIIESRRKQRELFRGKK